MDLLAVRGGLAGVSVAALGFLLWACLVGLATVWILVAARARPGLPLPLWAPLLPRRRLSPSRLERQILRAVARRAVLDSRGVWVLPTRVQVLLAPVELHALGPLADHLADNVADWMTTLAQKRAWRLTSDPEVTLATVAGQRPGRPLVRTRFGRPASGQKASSRHVPLGTANGPPAVLRRLEPRGRPLPLSGRHVRMGRRGGCDLAISEPTVSRRHASMHWRMDGWYVTDHGSTNGTFVNGSRVAVPTRLADGDELRLGQRVRLRFSTAAANWPEAAGGGVREQATTPDRGADGTQTA